MYDTTTNRILCIYLGYNEWVEALKVLKKWFNWFIRFWKGVWSVVKSMGNWKGVLSLLITWLAISGSGISLIGIILINAWLIGIGATIYGFWLLPLTPLIPINIAIAMLIQRAIFRDKNVSFKVIKAKFKEAFKGEKDDK